jgi:potassium-dependent mechanosensitive channel
MTRLPRLARIRAVFAGVLLGLMAVSAVAQQTTPLPAGQAQPPAAGAPAGQAASDLDYAAWERLAERVEAALEDTAGAAVGLDGLRAQLADWREALLVAQSANSARISTLRQQVAALGPAPEEGQTEAEEIAARRAALTEQLVRLQAPSIAAEEAYRRADGLIAEIDRTVRERQTSELLQLYPSPLNPANWPAAFRAASGVVAGMLRETTQRLATPAARETMVNNLPAILFFLLLGVGLIWQGRKLVRSLIDRITQRWSARGVRIALLFLSLGQIALPMFGVLAFTHALRLTGMFGINGSVLLATLPAAGVLVFGALWLGGRLFPHDHDVLPLRLTDERRTEGRLLTGLYGGLLAFEALRREVMDTQSLNEAALSVLAFPALILTAVLLVRVGRLMRLSVEADSEGDDEIGFRNRIVSLVGRGAVLTGVLGAALAAIGYSPAAAALVFPAATSLGLLGLLYLLQVLVTDIYAVIIRNEDGARNALVPVLVGFGLVLAALPLFALVWGARPADLTEIWTRLREGFTLGETRISPTNFLFFAVLFGFGIAVTRLFQGALRGTILPRTTLDQGARNALVSGVGYVGIFFAGLIAINSAGIDLSGLAIVAGALSVGIGFGLQNIVSNFVSGIILLIERPVSEGDWIEVGGVQGRVKSISVRSTRIETFDRTDVIVPNTDLVAGRVTNWTRFNLSGRLIVPVGVAYGSDTRKVTRILQEIAEEQPLAILNPPPIVAFMGLGADSMNFEIRVILRDVNFSISVRSEINHQIVRRFEEEGIEIPFAQSDVTLRNVDEIAGLLRSAMGQDGSAPFPKAARTPRRRPTKLEPKPEGTLPRDQFPGEGIAETGSEPDRAGD